MSNASVTLINTKGSVVAKNLTVTDQAALLNVYGVARGVYMLRVKANTKAGGFNRTMPVTIF
jgi:hypothetical protein